MRVVLYVTIIAAAAAYLPTRPIRPAGRTATGHAGRTAARLHVHKLRAPYFSDDYLSQLDAKGVETDEPPASFAARLIAAGWPRWATLIDEVLFVVASVMFIKGSFGFFPGASAASYIEGCELFEFGSFLYLACSLFALWEIREDARVTGRAPHAAAVFEQLVYIVGSALFVVGTALFSRPPVPAFESAAKSTFNLGPFGDWYVANVGDYAASLRPNDDEALVGDALFIVGSVLFGIAAFASVIEAAGDAHAAGGGGGSGAAAPDEGDKLRRIGAVACASLYEVCRRRARCGRAARADRDTVRGRARQPPMAALRRVRSPSSSPTPCAPRPRSSGRRRRVRDRLGRVLPARDSESRRRRVPGRARRDRDGRGMAVRRRLGVLHARRAAHARCRRDADVPRHRKRRRRRVVGDPRRDLRERPRRCRAE